MGISVRKGYLRPDTGQIFTVAKGLGRWWICGYIVRPGAVRRVKSKSLPPRRTREECWLDLDEYALRNNWTAVSGLKGVTR